MRTLAMLALLAAAAAAQDAADLAPKLRAALVKLRVTSQRYDLDEPWKKEPQQTYEVFGVVVEPGVVLTLADNVAHHVLLEVSVANSARRYPASLVHADSRIGLAKVKVEDAELAAQLRPLPMGEPAKLDDEFDLYQLGEDNLVERSTARVVRADGETHRLTLLCKTTASDRGTGQAAVRGGRLVGLLVETQPSKQEGRVVGVETLRHYLEDFADGDYDGVPTKGFWHQPLLRDDLRAYHGLGDRHGVAITRVLPGRTGDGALREGDVLLSAGGHGIDDEGKYVDAVHGRLDMDYLFHGRPYAGDTMEATVWRGGAEVAVTIPLVATPPSEMLVPESYDGPRPPFLVVGGLVLLELTQEQMRTVRRSPGGVILRRYGERADWDPPAGRRRIVYAASVFADRATKGYEVQYAPLLSLNGRPISDLSDVAVSLETPDNGFQVFRFEGLESDFVLRAKDIAEIDARIAEQYRVSRMRWLPGDPE